MVKALIKGKYIEDIIPILKKYKINIVENNPDIIITYGGDGTLLESERLYPNIPKLPIRDVKTAPMCEKHSLEGIIKALAQSKLEKHEISKLTGRLTTGTRELTGVNDIFIHNVRRNSAIRYKLWIDNELYLSEVASDCIGFATPYGSTGYFQSITHCVFKEGIGIAISNSREHVNHVIIKNDSEIKIKILRGPAIMVADNNPNSIELDKDDELIISRANERAMMYGVDAFMCNSCRKLRHLKI
jgi:NAD+ kinase